MNNFRPAISIANETIEKMVQNFYTDIDNEHLDALSKMDGTELDMFISKNFFPIILNKSELKNMPSEHTAIVASDICNRLRLLFI